MKGQELSKLKIPDAPGVYFFKRGETILYIGRATSLRDRVKSYFGKDLIKTRGVFLIDMVTLATTVECIQADSVLEGIILEANLIKKYQPKYNTLEKDDKSFNYVVFTDEEYPRVLMMRGKDLEDQVPKGKFKYIFGPYPQGGVLKEGMKIIRRIFGYRDKCTPVSDSPNGSNVTGKPCFNRQIGLCPGVCTGEISKKEYGRIIQNLKLFFEGKKGDLLKKLNREMKEYAKNLEFEKAQTTKKTIFALTHIQDVSLIKAERLDSYQGPTLIKPKGEGVFRMEGYDIAHMSGSNMGGVMVVLEENHIKKSDYRLFKIRGQKGVNDISALEETLNRRLNHSEWPYPNVIVVDGGIAQKRAAEALLAGRGFDIAVIAVTKNEKHRPESMLGLENIIQKYKKEILLLNSEAHRFAIKYHRKMRRGSFL
ncbi:MAG: UvrB/UvrC motif-containing protein [Candidatus Taylorbacteria bacterium]